MKQQARADGYRVLLKRNRTVAITKNNFVLYRWLGLIRPSRRDHTLGRLRRGLIAASDGNGGLQFRLEQVEPIVRYRLGSCLANVERKSMPIMSADEIAFYRFYGAALTDDITEIETMHHLGIYEKFLARQREQQQETA